MSLKILRYFHFNFISIKFVSIIFLFWFLPSTWNLSEHRWGERIEVSIILTETDSNGWNGICGEVFTTIYFCPHNVNTLEWFLIVLLLLTFVGRHRCECQASKHSLINNCVNCGRVVCEQEGSGPCLFCGSLVWHILVIFLQDILSSLVILIICVVQ